MTPTTQKNQLRRLNWWALTIVTLSMLTQVSCQKSATTSASPPTGGGTTSSEEQVDFEVSGTFDPIDFVQAEDSVQIGGVNLNSAGTYVVSAFYLSPNGKRELAHQGSFDGDVFSFKSKVPRRYLTIDVVRQSDGYRLGAFLPPPPRGRLAKLKLNRTSDIAAKMANIIADKAAAGNEAALMALATNSISVADTLIIAKSVNRVITTPGAKNNGISVDLAALAAKLVEKSNDKINALQTEGQSILVIAEKMSDKTYEMVFGADAQTTPPETLAYRTNHDLGSSATAKRDVAYEAIIAVISPTTKFIDAAFRVDAEATRKAESLSAAVAAQGGVATTYSVKFNACANGLSSCAPAGYTPPAPPSLSSSAGGSSGDSNTCQENGWCATAMTYYLGGAATSLDMSGSGIWNNLTYTNGSLKAVITITVQPASQTASNGSAAFSVTATVTNNATISYQWEKQEGGSGGLNNITGATSATLNLSNLTNADDNGDVYRVVVSATGGATSLNSFSVSLTVPAGALGVPTAVTGIAGNAQVALMWTAPSSNGGAAITDYLIQYSSDNGSTWTTFSDGISTSASASVTGLTNGTAYIFRVAAVNSAGQSSYSSSSNSATPTAPTPVITINTQPSNQTAASGSATFSVAASATENAALSYQWQKKESNGSSFSNISGATSTTLNLPGLTNAPDDGDVYRVVVSATGGAASVTSNAATLTVNPCPADGWCSEETTYYIGGSPTPLDMNGSGIWNNQTYSYGSLKAILTITSQPTNQTAMNGTASFNVSVAVTNGATISYQWQKQAGGSGSFSDVSGASSATLNLSNLTPQSDNGAVYRLLISATGEANPVMSDNATLTVLAAQPSAPTGVAGTPGDSQISLSWTAPSSIGASALLDYIVQYSSDSGSHWTTFDDGVSTSSSAIVTGLTNGTAYIFRVAATNSGGMGSYSNSSSSVTPEIPIVESDEGVTLRIPFDVAADPSNQTAIVDTSPSPKLIADATNVTLTTTTGATNGSSGDFTAGGNLLVRYPFSDDFQSRAFVIQANARLKNAGDIINLFYRRNDSRSNGSSWTSYSVKLYSEYVLFSYCSDFPWWKAGDCGAFKLFLPVTLAPEQWYRIVVQRDLASQFSVYVDGVPGARYMPQLDHNLFAPFRASVGYTEGQYFNDMSLTFAGDAAFRQSYGLTSVNSSENILYIGGAGYLDNYSVKVGVQPYSSVQRIPAPGADPHYSNVSLLMHFNEADGQNFVDSGTYGFEPMKIGSPTMVNTQSSGSTNTLVGLGTRVGQFGSGNAAWGAGNFLTFPDGGDAFDLGAAGDFTIEFWGRIMSHGPLMSYVVYSWGGYSFDVNYGWSIYAGPLVSGQSGAAVAFRAYNRSASTSFYGGTGTEANICSFNCNNSGLNITANGYEGVYSNFSFPSEDWNHYAFTRSGNIIRIFLNGRLIAYGPVPFNFSTSQADYNGSESGFNRPVFTLGGMAPTFPASAGAQYKEVRITRGVARYSADFAVQSRPFSDSATVPTHPGAPTITSLDWLETTSSQTFKIKWRRPANGGAPISDYVIQYSTDAGATWENFNDGVSTTQAIEISSLPRGPSYLFRVLAVNLVGQGTPSAPAFGVRAPKHNFSVGSSDTAEFSVVPAFSGQSVSFQWQAQDSNGLWQDLPGFTSATLQMSPNFNYSMSGNWYDSIIGVRCVVSSAGYTTITSKSAYWLNLTQDGLYPDVYTQNYEWPSGQVTENGITYRLLSTSAPATIQFYLYNYYGYSGGNTSWFTGNNWTTTLQSSSDGVTWSNYSVVSSKSTSPSGNAQATNVTGTSYWRWRLTHSWPLTTQDNPLFAEKSAPEFIVGYLKVEVPTPVITISQQPGNQYTNGVGTPATFEVAATVTQGATLTYQWERKLFGQSGFSALDGATNAALQVDDDRPSRNCAQYRVVVAATGATSVTSEVAIYENGNGPCP